MRFWVGITDRSWYEQLSAMPGVDEVNFWQPGGNRQFRTLKIGEPFLFKLHSPDNFIVGGGFFSHSSIMPASLAWQAFGPKNGASTEIEMRRRIEHYRRMTAPSREDYDIGCILLESPFFFRREDWIPLPDWRSPTMQGKGFDSQTDGKEIWDRVGAIIAVQRATEQAFGQQRRYGDPILVLPRLGQGSFRLIVTDLYRRRCAFTKSPVLHVLEAAHIKPYAEGGPHDPQNGLLLRQDLHTLFDKGYVTVTPQYRIEVSRRLKEEWDNGKEYYALHGSEISLPDQARLRPESQMLTWHNEHRFLG
jgi:putative restriction endonuclease